MTRLSKKNIKNLSSEIVVPIYSRDQDCGVVHLGTGAFHRGHQAVYFDKLLSEGEEDWMIIGASLKSDKVAQDLNPQDGLYSLVIEGSQTSEFQIIGSISKVIYAPKSPEDLIKIMSSPQTSLVTLTITEKGYCIDLGTRELDLNNEGLKSDIKDISNPKTAPGYLVAALSKRKDVGLPPFTVISCDNIPNNGDLTRKAVVALATKIDSNLAVWIDENCAFPSSMVDRIVPATSENDISTLTEKTGVIDKAMVKTEAFSQWVVEDHFSDRRPPLDNVGVQFTNDVSGWENAKLRLLNGAHSSLAYLGGLGGFRFVHEAIIDPNYRLFVERLWDEVEPTLKPVKGLQLADYRQALIARFQNSALEHQTYQIATDGSQKIPQRFLASWRGRQEKSLESPMLSLAIASWIKWQFGRFDNGVNFVVNDPLAAQTNDIIQRNAGDWEATLSEILNISHVFAELGANQEFFNHISKQFRLLNSVGAVEAVAHILS